jgi:hypothetical protein
MWVVVQKVQLDSHILQTMTVYAATDNKLMYVCACGFYSIF